MTKIKKSELKKSLDRSIAILKRSLEYRAFCYFILATLFLYYASEAEVPFSFQFYAPLFFERNRRDNRNTLQRKKWDLLGDASAIFSEVEVSYPSLKGVLLPSIPKSKISDEDLIELGDELNRLEQQTGIFSSTNSFSQAYDYWLTQLAKLTVKQGVSFYTPRSVRRLMVGLIKPTSGMAIYDPTVRVGGMFIESANYIVEHGGDTRSVEFYGCETAPDIWAICKMNMLVHGLDNAFIEQQDALENQHDVSGRFDIILQNLPLPQENSNKGQARRANEAFLRHMLEGLAVYGRGAILSPSSLIQEDHREFWQQVIGRDWLEAVISLPAKLLHGTNAAATLLIFNKHKLDRHKNKVIFISALNTPLPHARHNELEESDIQAAINAFEEWKRIPDFANVVNLTQIEEHDFKLGVEKYLHMTDAAPPFDITTALKRYHTAVQEREMSMNRLMKSLAALDHPSDTN